MNTPEELKEIPKNCTKEKIYRMYVNLSSTHVRAVIIQSILEHNKRLPDKLKQSIHISKLNEHHINYIVDTLGTAPGYKAMEGEAA